ncbi:MAG: hypothetical protein ACXVRZ_14170 [Gaiellaceae bacterium]
MRLTGGMSSSLLRTCLELGGIALAIWLDLRFEARRPASLRRRVGHGAAALLALTVTGAVVARFGVSASAELRLALLFVVFLPALAYACLAMVWLVRALAEVIRTYA